MALIPAVQDRELVSSYFSSEELLTPLLEEHGQSANGYSIEKGYISQGEISVSLRNKVCAEFACLLLSVKRLR